MPEKYKNASRNSRKSPKNENKDRNHDTDHGKNLRDMLPEEYRELVKEQHFDVLAWEMAHRLTIKIYHLTMKFPPEVFWGLTYHLRHICTVIPTQLMVPWDIENNAACRERFEKAYNHLGICSYLLRVARDRELVDQNTYWDFCGELSRMQKLIKCTYRDELVVKTKNRCT